MNLALDPARSVSVAASAGSGKTWQLVSRVLRLLLDGADPGGILALTFTRKAAAEMRERVEARLRELAYADDTALDAALRLLDLEPDAALRERARGLHEALLFAPFGLRAQTLHAFCQDVLSRFPVEAGVPAGFALVENERELLARALDRLLERIRREPGGRESAALDRLVAQGAGESQIRGWLRGFVEKRSDWWAYAEDWQAQGEDVVAAAAQLALDLGLDPDDVAPPDAAYDDAGFRRQLLQLHDLLVEVAGLGSLKADLIAGALAADDGASRGREAARLLTGKGERRSFKIKKGVGDAQFARIAGLYDALCTTMESVREQQRRRLTLARTEALLALGTALLDELAAQLRAANALSFADLEWRTCRLLRRGPNVEWVQYKLDRRLDHLLLDEFQDTNPTQWSLLLPLLAEMAAGDAGRRRTAFVVGDAKQSIYGFRRANPELMRVAADYVREALRGDAMPLNDSRRSAPAVIDFVNALFTGPEGAQIGFERHGTWRRTDWGAVEIAPLVRAVDDDRADPADGLRDPLRTPRRIAEDQRLRTEARQVAERIAALLAARLPVRGDAGPRPLGPGDVMILARQRTHLHAIERALAERGIAFVGSSRGTLLDTVVARDLVALLRFLDTPQRSLELATVLRSPLFSAGDDDLVQLARAGEPGEPWWPRLQHLAETGAAGQRLLRAAAALSGWLAAARTLPAHDLLDRVVHESDAAARYAAALPGDARVPANLGAFLQLVLDTDQGRYPTLGRLNRRLEDLAAAGRDAPDEAPPPAVGGAVRVMTIHASKGLEAPAVFLVNTAPTPNTRSDGWLVEWPSDAERPQHFLLAGRAEDRDTLSRALLERQQARDAREALNLLYVAVTRAQHYLFVSAFESRRGDAVASWHGRCRAAAETLAATHEPLPGAPSDAVGHRSGEFPALAATPAVESLPPGEDPALREPVAAMAAPAAPSADDEGPRDPDAAARGIAIHWLLQQLADGRRCDDDAVPARLLALLGVPVARDDYRRWLDEARRVLAAPALRDCFNDDRYRRCWNEVPVQWLADGELRSGVIDRLVDDGGQLLVIDYKTAPRPRAEALVARHRAQLAAYAEAVAALWPGRRIVAGLIATASAEWIEVLRR